MRVVKSIGAMQRQARRWKREGLRIAFVPTMGYLHEGHLSLIRRARRAVGSQGQVVVSIYVNPTQFGPTEDFATYPRDFGRDRELCRQHGTDLIFAPSDREMYPKPSEGAFSTYVVEEALSGGMEGASRPTHFKGVATVVAKLFNIVQPDVVIFGAKDFQQAAVIRRMIRDLNFPIRLILGPTHRQPDGLATSSRNEYLSPEERRQAVVLWKSLQHAQRKVREAARPIPSRKLKSELARLIGTYRAAKLDYIEVFDPETLVPVSNAAHGTHLALAVWVGSTRLIDNGRL